MQILIDLNMQIKSKFIFKNRLDLGFLPKDILYNDKTTYGESTINLLAAIEILEKAQDSKDKIIKNDGNSKEDDSFWSKMNPFKCGTNN